jgi:endo-1,4-beta-D-glucanase Y
MTGLVVAVPGVMGSRLMINVRSAYYRNEVSPSSISLHIPEVTDTLSEFLALPLRISTLADSSD